MFSRKRVELLAITAHRVSVYNWYYFATMIPEFASTVVDNNPQAFKAR